MKISIFGTGYVGLVTGACLAEVGHDVLCVDIQEERIEALNQGIVPIFEPGLERMIMDNRVASRLHFTIDSSEALLHGDVIFIAVGTPSLGVKGACDISHVLSVAETIGHKMQGNKIIVNKSTVPVGTTSTVLKTIQKILEDRTVLFQVKVASNPEFLKEGNAIEDFMKPDRIIIGSQDEEVIKVLKLLYAPFNRNHDRLLIMDEPSAELTKYAANAMLATKISFMNEISNIAECMGADIEYVRQGIGSDHRIGYQFIYPGCGYGGSCFPKDVAALIHLSKSIGYEPQILKAVETVNQYQKNKLYKQISTYYADNLRGKCFAIWGLAFKPNTNDMREAPSIDLINALLEKGSVIQAYDPEAMDMAQSIYGQRKEIFWMGTKEACLRNADALVICTEWRVFRAPDFHLIKALLREPIIFDGRNLYDPKFLKQQGIRYFGIGRGESLMQRTNVLQRELEVVP